MRHLFKVTERGWEGKKEGIWFDSNDYTKDEAEAQFKPFKGTTQRGYPYTGYEYEGRKYYKVEYLGEYEDDQMPQNDQEYRSIRQKQKEN